MLFHHSVGENVYFTSAFLNPGAKRVQLHALKSRTMSAFDSHIDISPLIDSCRSFECLERVLDGGLAEWG